MVIVVPSKRVQALYAVVVVVAFAMMVDYGTPLLLDYLTAHSWPAWVCWVTAWFAVIASVTTYRSMLPIGSTRVLHWGKNDD